MLGKQRRKGYTNPKATAAERNGNVMNLRRGNETHFSDQGKSKDQPHIHKGSKISPEKHVSGSFGNVAG
jgi:hypothetical protein